MKYIITGNLGQIGIELKKRLDLLDWKCVDSADLRNGTEIRKLKGKADIFFHLASFCKINQTITNPSLAFENTKSVYEALEFCRKNKVLKFVFFSSSRILCKEKNPYTASKIFGEELCKAYKECYGIDYLIIRPSTVYGGLDKTRRLIQIWIDNSRQNKNLIIYGNKSKTLNFTHMDDFFKALFFILEGGGWNKEYNIFGFKRKVNDFAKEIVKQTKSKSKIIFQRKELSQPQKFLKKDKKLTKLGYIPQINLKKGIGRILSGI